MTTIEARETTPTKRAKPQTSVKPETQKPNRKSPAVSSAAGEAEPIDERHSAHDTKQDRILALLRRREGVTISDLMQASGWQQHSVRGFLAGTVKAKLGLNLTSSKQDGECRRYRIAPTRGR